MSKGLFRLLCDEIVGLIGIGEFKSEEFLNEMMDSDDPRCRRMMVANEATTGGFICGEIKLATTIRILGGCSPMAMAIMFDFSFATAYKIFKHVISNWLSHESFCPIDGVKYCSDDNHMKSVALQFCESSLGIINGCIGALDGWIVKVQKPLKSDGVNNPQSFYSRKGYYGVNVQAICDKNKKFCSVVYCRGEPSMILQHLKTHHSTNGSCNIGNPWPKRVTISLATQHMGCGHFSSLRMTIQCTDLQRIITTFSTPPPGYPLSVLLERLT
jgi:hypothetical protein